MNVDRPRGRVRRTAGHFECIEAYFRGVAYAPHRHDTYTLALTTHGVQQFDYRGSAHHSLPGQVVILHPDERHDGRAGTDAGFGYRAVNLRPEDVQRVLGYRALPFVSRPVCTDPRLRVHLERLLKALADPLEDAEYEDTLFDLVQQLVRLAGRPEPARPPDRRAAAAARAYIDARLSLGFALPELERVTGRSRWQLSRDFRVVYGTSPYRYLVLRRLDEARTRLLAGEAAATVALDCGFADQAHLNRRFKQAYGLPPGRWRSLVDD